MADTVLEPVTPVLTVDATGAHTPDYDDILAFFQIKYRSIYGQDIDFDPATQDAQWLAVIARAVYDCNISALRVFNSFSPSNAQGTGLSSLVKINGLRRKVPSRSTVDVDIVGVAGTAIQNGIVTDNGGNSWLLPRLVTIPYAGTIRVTAQCAAVGAVAAAAGTVVNIATTIAGWQSVNNANAASPGLPVEYDPQLRQRQSISTALPAQSVLTGLRAQLAALAGVTRSRIYENDTGYYDDADRPGHTISAVVEGGDVAAIAATLFRGKGAGVGTHGDTLANVTDAAGATREIRFWRPQRVNIGWYVQLKPLRNYTFQLEESIRATLAAWTNDLYLGESVMPGRAYAAANLYGTPASACFDLLSVVATRDGTPPAAQADVPLNYYETAYCEPGFVDVRIVK